MEKISIHECKLIRVEISGVLKEDVNTILMILHDFTPWRENIDRGGRVDGIDMFVVPYLIPYKFRDEFLKLSEGLIKSLNALRNSEKNR